MWSLSEVHKTLTLWFYLHQISQLLRALMLIGSKFLNVVMQRTGVCCTSCASKIWHLTGTKSLLDLTSMNLPVMFGTPVSERKDLNKKRDAAADMESIREDVNLRLSVSTGMCNNCKILQRFQLDLIDHLSQNLGKRKKSYNNTVLFL